MENTSRRQVLSGIGAGAAGLAAARMFREKGIRYKLLEAKGRIGGRAFTDNTTFGKPFDLGCAFQHQSEKNPFVNYAKQHKFKIGNLPADENSLIWIGRREATGRQYQQIERRYEAIREAFLSAGRSARDISASDAVKHLKKSKYDRMVMRWMTPGSEPDDISILDWWNGADGSDQFSPDGYGNIVSHFGRDVGVSLNTTVKEVDWSGSGVKVTTSNGVIAAKFCIVTVSNGVFASGAIKFTPELKERQEFVHGIAMASYTTVGLKFSKRNVLPTIRNAWFHHLNKQNDGMNWVDDIGRSGVVRGNIHGSTAKALEAEGEKAIIDYALGELKKALGSKGVPRLKKAIATRWSQDPHILGTWSAASPGFGRKRLGLRRTVGKRLFFAGEACHRNMYATCHGARLSGEEAARNAARQLG